MLRYVELKLNKKDHKRLNCNKNNNKNKMKKQNKKTKVKIYKVNNNKKHLNKKAN